MQGRKHRYDQIMECLSNGDSVESVAKQFATDKKTIKVYELALHGENAFFSDLEKRIKQTQNLSAHMSKMRERDAEKRQQAIDLYKMNYSMKQVCKMVHSGHERVCAWLEEAGIVRRKQGENINRQKGSVSENVGQA